MSEVKGYCRHCGRETWQTVPGYACQSCGKSGSSGSAEGGALGCGVIGAGALFAVVCVAMLAVNSLMLLPLLITRPWGLVGSVLLVRWLWKRDNLGADKAWLRFGVSAFLILWMGLFIIAVTAMIYRLQLGGAAKEMLIVTLPGFGLGILAGNFFGRPGTLWPGFVGICLAHTIGKANYLWVDLEQVLTP